MIFMSRKEKKNQFLFVFSILSISMLVFTACQSDPKSQLGEQPRLTFQPEIPTPLVEEITTSNEAPTATEEINFSPDKDDPSVQLVAQSTLPAQPTVHPTRGADDWQNLPVVPVELSERAREIYQQGLAMGNDPTHFSKLGDCQNITTYFLAMYDHPGLYTLGEQYAPLQDTIDYYAGSWSRESKSVKGGFNVASVFNPLFSDREVCEKNETPLDCELRLNKPSIVLISMEEWWNGDVGKYETYLRKIVDTVIAHGALPILATKADNLEGKHAINRAIVNLAEEYELPLWNFWAAVQPITAHGLQKDGFHLTMGINDFTSSIQLKRGWVQRNLTALQVLDAVRRELGQP